MDNGFVKVGKWGECLWGIDENGNLLIDGGEAASLADAEVPWKEYVPELVTVIASRKVTFPDGASLAGLFKGCKKMLRADLSGFDTSNVSDMSSMFEGCVRLTDLDLSSFDTYACSDMTNMFHQCAALSDILLGDSFSTDGDGSTDCGNLAVKEYGKYKKAKPFSVEGFTVTYHSNYPDDPRDMTEERRTVPNFRYVLEEDLFDEPDETSAFIGWCGSPLGKGEIYEGGCEVETIDEDTDLYAIWGKVPEVADIEGPISFTYGSPIPFELPEITSVNDPHVSGYLEVSPTGEEGSWEAIEHTAILPVAYDGYLLRLHVSNSIGDAVSNEVRLNIQKANIDASAVRWAEDEDMRYDGSVKRVWLEGLPEGIEPVYSGNEAVEAGTYTASFDFEFDRDNFNDPLIVREHEWTIRKAPLDLSEVHWDYNGPFEYDGFNHGVGLTGLPEGVTARYENNTRSAAGEYTATAKLVFDEANYEKPREIAPCEWKIKSIVLDPSELEWSGYEEHVYDGSPKSVYVTNLPEDAEYEYEGAEEVPAGKYLARLSLHGNYALAGPAEYEWEIAKASYDMSGVSWSKDHSFTYDGDMHGVSLYGVPEGIEVKYSENEGKYAGDYTARASFINPDTHNYLTPDDMTLDWSIHRKEADMSAVRWNYDGAFTYDGEMKRVELEGVPEGIYVEYENASAHDAGVYNAHAVLKYDRDNLIVNSPADCQWKINKKKIDISEVCWDYTDAFVYNGREQGVYLLNVPEGVEVEYEGNVKVAAGKYAASATLLPNDSVNYEVPEISGLTWSIGKADLSLPELRWTDCSGFVYDGTEKSVEIESELGDEVSVEYTGSSAKTAGTYYAKAIFSAVDDSNYKAPQSEGYSWNIAKATKDMSGVYWDYTNEFVYDGSVKSVALMNIPEGVSVEYENASETEAGNYTAVARFSVNDADNYEDNIPEMTLDWHIAKATFDMSSVKWQELKEFAYDGEEKSVRLTGLPDGLTPEYEDNTAINAGEYIARASFDYDTANYEEPACPSCHWIIERAPVDVSAVRWDFDEAFVYDGLEKTVAVENIPEGTSVVYNNASASRAGTYVASAEIIPEDTDNLMKARVENLTWRIEKGDYDMSYVSWDYDKPFTYDGSEHKVTLRGLPEGALPSYRGNSAVSAGTYKATVNFSAADNRNFNTPDPIELEWNIEKADFDMSGVSWDYDGEFKYDGRMHEVVLRGLPEGLRVMYSGNAAADTGKYTASAELLPYDTENCNSPEVDSCNWEIVKADYDMSAVKWDYSRAKVYNGREQSVMLEQLPNGVFAEYSGNEATDAGSYTASAVLTVADPDNYNLPSVSDCDWEIDRADYDMSACKWDYKPGMFIYDGSRKSVSLNGLPENVSASYTGNSAEMAGDYTATASFTTSDDNFNAPEPVELGWSIGKADYDMSSAAWDYKQSFVYDGTVKKVQLNGIPSGVSVSYESNSAVDAGVYTAKAIFDIDTNDYNVPEPMICEWTIEKADPDIRTLRWDYAQPFVYDGSEKSVTLAGVPETLEVELSGDTAYAAGDYTAHADLIPRDPANYNAPSIRDCGWKIVKADYDMSNARWEGDTKSIYDGKVKSVAIEGLPEGLTPVYHGNTATEAGEYTASADFEYDADNYNMPSIRDYNYSIGKATYDMSGVFWAGTEGFVYDGKTKFVMLEGLPAGIKPVYEGNSATDVGNYDATVSFEYDEHNYYKPEFGGCSFEIEPATIVIDEEDVSWDYSEPFVYDGTEKSVAIEERVREQGLFDRLRGKVAETVLAGIPEGFNVVYEGNTATEAGVYYATAKLVDAVGDNYKELQLPKCKWEIVKAPIDVSDVRWDYSEPFVFDGEEKSVELTGVPETVSVSYTNNRALNAGGYEAMATLEAVDPANYEQPAPVSGCWWHIDKASYDMSDVHWDYEGDFVYDGEEKSVELVGLPDGVTVDVYLENRAIEAGTYVAEARLSYRNSENYEEPVVSELKWRITRKKIDTSDIRWDYDEDTLFVYDEKPKEVKLISVPDEVEVVYTDNSKINAGTYTARARLIYDTHNCEADEIPDLRWKIAKAEYDTSDVHWNYEEPFSYDGTEKSIALEGVPSSINVRYRDNRALAAGTYTAKAYLTYDNDNYEEPDIDTTIEWEIR